MKDFDVDLAKAHAERETDAAERMFKLGGKTFTYKANPSYTALGKFTSDEAGDVIKRQEEGLLGLLDPGQEEAFLAVLHDTANPITMTDLNEIINWVMEAQAGRPTQAPSLSTPGGATTSTPSTDGSSSPRAVVSAA